jgi:hypothetical protein
VGVGSDALLPPLDLVGPAMSCQHKIGCSETALFRAVATISGHTHTRLLCKAHAQDALKGDGMRFLDARVQTAHGRLRRAAEFLWIRRGRPGRPSGMLPSRGLRVAVAADAKLQVGDLIPVRAELQKPYGYAVPCVVWGVAKIDLDLGQIRTAPSGHTYRFAHISRPEKWSTIYASVRVYDLNFKRRQSED